jgi:hypothetical protein
VLYHDSAAAEIETTLSKYDAVLVWINPIEQGNDRKVLDVLLTKLSARGCFVSAHPEIILKMGTKEILFKTRDTAFGGDIKLYRSFEDFKEKFINERKETRILKQFRGNGGSGIFKINTRQIDFNRIGVTHAKDGAEEELMSIEDFLAAFRPYFDNDSLLIDQAWNPNIINGMVRCYLCGTKVAGFGYQEINALYPSKKPSQRFYFSEDCGLFQDLRNIMENSWLPQLQNITAIKNDMLPVIWDADFFINNVNSANTNEKYSLCEINASCVSPFPESSIPFIVKAVSKKLNQD